MSTIKLPARKVYIRTTENECNILAPVYEIGDFSFIVTKKDATECRTSKFWNAYEYCTGHWVAVASTEEDLITQIQATINRLGKETMQSIIDKYERATPVGGLFSFT